MQNNENNENNIKFPIYSPGQIKNYVYINKIITALLIIEEKNSEIFEEINILNSILPFLGPNYNFYKDLDIKLDFYLVIKHILLQYNKQINKNNVLTLQLHDTFGNIYNLKNDYLTWNPNLQL